MSVRKPTQVRAQPMAPMAPMAMKMATAAPVSDMSRLSLVLGAGAKEAAAREAEATGVRPGKEVVRRVRKVIPDLPEGGIQKPSFKNLGKSRPRLFGDDDDNASNASGNTWADMLEEAEAQDLAAKEEAEMTDEEGREVTDEEVTDEEAEAQSRAAKDKELKEIAAQRAQMALGPREMVKARLFTLAARFNIDALEQFLEMATRAGDTNLMMMTHGRIQKKMDEYAQMMASNGFRLEAKLKSSLEGDKYFQMIYAKMRDSMQLAIRIHLSIEDEKAFYKLEKAAEPTAALTMRFAGTELEQPGPKDRAEAKDVEDTADRLVVMIMDLVKQ